MGFQSYNYKIWALTAWLCVLSGACSTGIEGTRTIKMSRTDKRDSQPGEEQTFIAALHAEPLSEWIIGKSFMISDNKAAVIFEGPTSISTDADSAGLTGRVISYAGISSRPTPGGGEVVLIDFRDGQNLLRYNTSRKYEDASKLINGLNIPMLIDLDLVAEADSMLRSRQLWTRSRLWYDDEERLCDGRKFVPVRINRVKPGNMVFPLKVEFTDTAGRDAHMLMNVASVYGNGSESRTFPTLFSLTDPKLKYPSITLENWELICSGRVANGMTKDECRLALGNPSEVDSGHNWDYVMDVWRYKDGTFLQFKDGLLVGFRR